ncbi:MAG: histidine ammonia-lyase [Phycisphaerales bacterium]
MAHSTKSPLALTTGPISIDDVVAVARRGRRVTVSPKSITAMKRSRRVVEDCLTDGQPHYGINTGFGSLAKQRIGPADLRTLQRNLIRSHTAGVGEPLREELVRAMMLCLAASLARGLSGVRPLVVDTIVAMLNKGVTPVVPSIGSVGASGDLAPLAAVALAAIGEGNATYHGRRMPGAAALKAAGIKPLTLEAKEGLALINGTHLMCGEGALLVHDANELYLAATCALAMSIDACRASHAYLDERLYAARSFDCWGVASNMRLWLEGSEIVNSHRDNDPRVQDPYSLRAAPTVLGAAWGAINTCEWAIERELSAVTDNPLVFANSKRGEEKIISGANFHGMPIALPLDYLAIALCHLAGISERRTYLMTGAFEPESHLKPFLAPKPGLQSGLMIAQYTAAACVNEMIGLATPATVSNIPTCAGMEDYNSWGPRAAAKARRALELARRVIAVELLCAAQGIEQHRPLKSGEAVERAIKIIRRKVKPLTEDRPLTEDIEAIAKLIEMSALLLDP